MVEFKIQKKSVVDKSHINSYKLQSQRHILMFNKNPIAPVRPLKAVKKELSEDILARFQIEPVENNQGGSRRRLKKLCEVNQSEEMIQPQEEENHLIEEEQYKQFEIKDDEDLRKQREAEQKARENKKLKGNQDLEKFIKKQQEKEKKPKKEEKSKPQAQMSMEDLMKLKKQKKKQRKNSDDFFLSDYGQNQDEQIDEMQLMAKRMAAYEIYNGIKDSQQDLINKTMQLSFTAASKKSQEEQQKFEKVIQPRPFTIQQRRIVSEQNTKKQPKSAKKINEQPQPVETGPLAGFVISTSGEFEHLDKQDFLKLCEQLGAECPKSFVVRCNLLIQGSYVLDGFKRRTNQPVEQTEKSRKAREKGIRIITYDRINDFFLETTGISLQQQLGKREVVIINPVNSFMFKQIETKKQNKLELYKEDKPFPEYKQIKPLQNEPKKTIIHNQPVKPVQIQHIKSYNPPRPIQREQKMDIETPKPISLNPTSLLWSDKYKPTKLEQVIGQSNQIKSLREWLQCWEDIHLKGNKRDVKQQKGWNAGGSINSFAALLSGDPGIGKTTTARLIAKQFGYAITEFNASDVRNKSGIDLMETGSFNLGRRTMQKSLIIMDEVDGMSSGDRGGITAIIGMIKSTKVPIICICNDRSSDKIRSLAGHCLDVKFIPPNKAHVVRRLMQILRQEGGSAEQRALEQLVDTFQNDMRQILCYLEVIFKTVSKRITMNTLTSRNQSSKDATVMINHVDAVRRLLNRSEFNRMSIEQRADCFFVDSDMVPLYVQQNLIISARKTNMNLKQMRNIVEGLHALVIGDMLDRSIRKQQEWGLMPSYAFMSCVYAPEKMSESCGFPTFPQWLGKFSSERKMKRISKEFKDAILPAAKIGSWKAAKENYVPIIIRELCEMLKQDRVQNAVQLMEQYNITPAIITDHLNSLYYTTGNDKNPLTEVPSAMKAKLTRLYNKRHEDSKMKQVVKAKNKNQHVKFDPLMQELESVNQQQPQEEQEEAIAVKGKPKNKKK